MSIENHAISLRLNCNVWIRFWCVRVQIFQFYIFFSLFVLADNWRRFLSWTLLYIVLNSICRNCLFQFFFFYSQKFDTIVITAWASYHTTYWTDFIWCDIFKFFFHFSFFCEVYTPFFGKSLRSQLNQDCTICMFICNAWLRYQYPPWQQPQKIRMNSTPSAEIDESSDRRA